MSASRDEKTGKWTAQCYYENWKGEKERRDIITTPKTEQSVRVIDIPQFLTKEIEMYVNRCYGLPDNERLFPIVAEAVQHKLKRACVKSGVKPIRVHDLRYPNQNKIQTFFYKD